MVAKTLEEMVAIFLANLKQIRKAATVQLHALYLGHFVKRYGHRPIEEIVKGDLLAFTSKRNPIIVLRSFFEWARKEGEAAMKNPARKIRIPKNGHREKILDRRERLKLCRSAGPHIREALFFLDQTGARPGELYAVTRENLRIMGEEKNLLLALANGQCFLALAHYKGRSRRINPNKQRMIFLNRRVGRLIARILKRDPDCHSGVIFRNSKGEKWNKNAFRSAFRRLRAKVFSPAADLLAQVVPYTLRHSFATRLAARGINPSILAEMLGHSTTKMCEWYIHPTLEDLRKWME